MKGELVPPPMLADNDASIVLEQPPFDLSFDEDLDDLSNDLDKRPRNAQVAKRINSMPSAEVLDMINADNASLVSSIISSDDSIRDKIGSCQELSLMEPTHLKQNSVMKRSSREQMISKFNTSKEVDRKIRRMLTADFSKDNRN